MTRLVAALAALCLAAIVGGTALYVQTAGPGSCDASSFAGAAIGAPFELVDTSGNTVTDAEIIDGPALVYFGYTFCPDVCPFDMARNALAVSILEEKGKDLDLVFVTVDPNRDTPEVLARYAEDMHPGMIALSGSDEQVKEAANAYRVYYAKGEGDDEFYLMDHSTFTYLMFPGNELGAFFRRDVSAEEIAEISGCLMASL